LNLRCCPSAFKELSTYGRGRGVKWGQIEDLNEKGRTRVKNDGCKQRLCEGEGIPNDVTKIAQRTVVEKGTQHRIETDFPRCAIYHEP
jgi:hypothetical protein